MTHDQASNSTDNSTDNSTHDPLCPFPDYPYNICWVCDLIAKVRANEKAKWTHTCPDNNCCNGSPN